MNQSSYDIDSRLPESLNTDNMHELAKLVDEKLHELDVLAESVAIYPRINVLSSELINELAVQLHVDFYDSTLPLGTRRGLVKNSIRWHVKKGTRAVVQEMANVVFGRAQVSEWFEYGGKPYHFKIDLLADAKMTPETAKLIVKAIETVKNVRSWLESIGFIRYADAMRYIGVAPCSYIRHEVCQMPAQSVSSKAVIYRGSVPALAVRHSSTQLTAMNSIINAKIYRGAGGTLYKKHYSYQQRKEE